MLEIPHFYSWRMMANECCLFTPRTFTPKRRLKVGDRMDVRRRRPEVKEEHKEPSQSSNVKHLLNAVDLLRPVVFVCCLLFVNFAATVSASSAAAVAADTVDSTNRECLFVFINNQSSHASFTIFQSYFSLSLSASLSLFFPFSHFVLFLNFFLSFFLFRIRPSCACKATFTTALLSGTRQCYIDHRSVGDFAM